MCYNANRPIYAYLGTGMRQSIAVWFGTSKSSTYRGTPWAAGLFESGY